MCRKLLHDYLFPAYCVYILVEFSMFVQMQGFSEYFHPCFLWHLERGCSSNCFYIRFKPFPFKFSTSRANFFFFFIVKAVIEGEKATEKAIQCISASGCPDESWTITSDVGYPNYAPNTCLNGESSNSVPQKKMWHTMVHVRGK